MEPFMKPLDRRLFFKQLGKATTYLEYGSGGSTVQASLRTNLRTIVSVESDLDWHVRVKTMIPVQDRIHHVFCDVKTVPNSWGYPGPGSTPDDLRGYSDVVRKLDPEIQRSLDLVLIDGRFRVACCLKCYDVVSDECVILFDDFLMRSHYHIILDYFTIVEQTADKCMVVLKKKAGSPPPKELIERYEIIAE
jgi:hypothetical protein